MNPLNEDDLGALNEVVNHAGWPVLMRILDQMVSGCTVENLSSNDELWEAKGSLAIVAFVKNVPAYVEQAFDAV